MIKLRGQICFQIDLQCLLAYLEPALIHRLFQDARKKAWAQLMSDPEVIQLITEQRRLDAQNLASLDKTANDLLLVNR